MASSVARERRHWHGDLIKQSYATLAPRRQINIYVGSVISSDLGPIAGTYIVQSDLVLVRRTPMNLLFPRIQRRLPRCSTNQHRHCMLRANIRGLRARMLIRETCMCTSLTVHARSTVDCAAGISSLRFVN